MGPDNIVDQVGFRLVAYQMRILPSAVVIHAQGLEILAILRDQHDGRGIFHRIGHCVAEHVRAELPSIDRDNLHRRRETCFKRWSAQANVDHIAVLVRNEAERIREVDVLPHLFAGLPEFRSFGRIGQLVAAIDDSVQRSVGRGRLQPFVQEGGPIVRLNGIKGFDDIFERVRLDLGTGRWRPGPRFAEIVDAISCPC